MNTNLEQLNAQLQKCHILIKRHLSAAITSSATVDYTDIEWLNYFCGELLEFVNDLQEVFYVDRNETYDPQYEDCSAHIRVCLLQITTCIKYLECTLKMEVTAVQKLLATRKHFTDRIIWCFRQLSEKLEILVQPPKTSYEQHTYADAIAIITETLQPYTCFERDIIVTSNELICIANLRKLINVLLRQTFAFANVALKEDKKVLSALCQKTLRDFVCFEDEGKLGLTNAQRSCAQLRLYAIALNNALTQLDEYMNGALLRLIYTNFLHHDKYSVQKLRLALRTCSRDAAVLDELIADFDVNLDRSIQIGILMSTLAPTTKVKVKLLSSICSFEILDTCLIPCLQACKVTDFHSEILEEHYNEEVLIYKNTIQEILKSHSFGVCYLEMVTKCNAQMAKQFDGALLSELAQMGEFLCEHFCLESNRTVIDSNQARCDGFERFVVILRECQSILTCSNQVHSERISRRFKILQSLLKKFVNTLNEPQKPNVSERKCNADVFSPMPEIIVPSKALEMLNQMPVTHSILYPHDRSMREGGHTNADAKRIPQPMTMPTPALLGVQFPKQPPPCNFPNETAKITFVKEYVRGNYKESNWI